MAKSPSRKLRRYETTCKAGSGGRVVYLTAADWLAWRSSVCSSVGGSDATLVGLVRVLDPRPQLSLGFTGDPDRPSDSAAGALNLHCKGEV